MTTNIESGEEDDTPLAQQEQDHSGKSNRLAPPPQPNIHDLSSPTGSGFASSDGDASVSDLDVANGPTPHQQHQTRLANNTTPKPQPLPHRNGNHNHLNLGPFYAGRDGGGSRSGAVTPAEGFSDDSDYFAATEADAESLKTQRQRSRSRTSTRSKKVDWIAESGMGSGARADTLGDGDSDADGDQPEDKATPGDDEWVEKEKIEDRKGFGEVY